MILKLLPGQRINFTVAAIEEVTGNFGPQLKFVGSTPDDANAVMFLNVEPAQRQLARIGLDTQSVIGRMVEFARTEKNGTKYTDINLPSGEYPKHAVQPHPTGMPQPSVKPVATSGKQPYSSGPALPYETETGAAPSPAPMADKSEQWNKLFNAYDVCFDHALNVAKKMDRAEVGSSPESVAAIAATLLIQADRQGLTR